MNEPGRALPQADDEPLYTDEHGVPMLFDVVIPGDYLKAAGVMLGTQEPPPPNPAPDPVELQRHIQAAIDAALPAATEQVMLALREALQREVTRALQGTDPEPRP